MSEKKKRIVLAPRPGTPIVPRIKAPDEMDYKEYREYLTRTRHTSNISRKENKNE